MGIAYEPARIAGRDDIATVLGFTEREFVEAILVEHGGRVERRVFTEYTAWSEEVVNRVLSTLEATGAIVRLSAGQKEIVSLPTVPDATNQNPSEVTQLRNIFV